MKPQIPWLRVFVEGMVIVGSILLAFGIEAWWEERQLEALERDTLERLAGQFVTVEAGLSDWQQRHVQSLDAATVLLTHAGPASTMVLSPDSVSALISAIRVPWTVNLPLATLTTLESSGQLAAIGNRELQVELADWRASLDDLQEDEQATSQTIFSYLIPFLLDHAAVRTINSKHPDPILNSSAVSAFPSDHRDLLRDPVFENLVEDRRMRETNLVTGYERVRDELSALRSSIQAELEARW